jgi:hypothetical protein
VAITEGIHVEMVMPANESATLKDEMDKAGGRKRVANSLGDIDVENANATNPEDKAKVKRAIEDTVGFSQVNKAVKKSIANMLGNAAFL